MIDDAINFTLTLTIGNVSVSRLFNLAYEIKDMNALIKQGVNPEKVPSLLLAESIRQSFNDNHELLASITNELVMKAAENGTSR